MMRNLAATAVLLGSLALLGGCAAVAGGAVGVGGTTAGYEVHLSNEKARVEKAYKDGKMSKEEHDIRLDQIRRDSAFQ